MAGNTCPAAWFCLFLAKGHNSGKPGKIVEVCAINGILTRQKYTGWTSSEGHAGSKHIFGKDCSLLFTLRDVCLISQTK